jgi:hypothetical protein
VFVNAPSLTLPFACQLQEFVKQAWNKKNKLELAPNVSALIEDFNQVATPPTPCKSSIEDSFSHVTVLNLF